MIGDEPEAASVGSFSQTRKARLVVAAEKEAHERDRAERLWQVERTEDRPAVAVDLLEAVCGERLRRDDVDRLPARDRGRGDAQRRAGRDRLVDDLVRRRLDNLERGGDRRLGRQRAPERLGDDPVRAPRQHDRALDRAVNLDVGPVRAVGVRVLDAAVGGEQLHLDARVGDGRRRGVVERADRDGPRDRHRGERRAGLEKRRQHRLRLDVGRALRVAGGEQERRGERGREETGHESHCVIWTPNPYVRSTTHDGSRIP